MLRTIAAMSVGFALQGAFAQSTEAPLVFEAASVKSSKSTIGHDGTVTTAPGRLIARNAPLKRLIFEAWQIPYAQITGGPAWLNTDEYDIDATTGSPVNVDQLRLMLRALLADRFKLAVRTEKKEGRVYLLVVEKGGPRLRGTKAEENSPRVAISRRSVPVR